MASSNGADALQTPAPRDSSGPVAKAAAGARSSTRRTGVRTVGLTGGVFANTVLTRECQGRLGDEGFTVLVHQQVPPNDDVLTTSPSPLAASSGAA